MGSTAHAFDPKYVQITRAEFASIIGRSISELDKMRHRDPRCPQGHKAGPGPKARVLFILQDCYDYSALLIAEAGEKRFP
jgi:hypothetical protein